MARQENFPISAANVENFINTNKKQWEQSPKSKDVIIVNLSMVRMQVAWFIPKLIFAKGLQDRTNARVVVLTWRENELLTRLFESFGFEHIVMDNLVKKSPMALIKASFKALGIWLAGMDGQSFKEIKMDGLTVGKSLYEDIIRTSALSTIRTTRDKTILKKLIHLLGFYYSFNSFLMKNNVVAAVIDDITYHEGLMIKQLAKFHCKEIYQMENVAVRSLKMQPSDTPETISNYSREHIKELIKTVDFEKASEWSYNYLQERFQGKNGREIDRGAFVDKKVLSKDELSISLGLDPNKKTIVIMAHTFTDGVFNYGENFFRDYYDWCEKTLEIAATVSDVNWILKPHPTRHSYNESTDSIESMFERICGKRGNMFLMSDDISGETIANVADGLITIGGNAGAEYSVMGIPAIIVGKPYYAEFGFTIEPKTLEEYRDCLEKISSVDKLNEEQIKIARAVFYLRNSEVLNEYYYHFTDDFAKYNNKKYFEMVSKMALQYFSSNEGTQGYNDDILKDLVTYFENHDMKECSYYTYGKEIQK